MWLHITVDLFPFSSLSGAQTRESVNSTVSAVTLVAEPGDDGATLMCKAYSTNLPGTVLLDKVVITVHCKLRYIVSYGTL